MNFFKENTTVIFTLIGIVITQLLSRWNISKQINKQHQSAVEREWATNVRVTISEILRYLDYKHKIRRGFVLTDENDSAIQDNLTKLELLLNFTREPHYTLYAKIKALSDANLENEEYEKLREKVVTKFQEIFYPDFTL